MTTINFPSTPALDQVYTLGDKSWAWNGTGWVAVHEPRATDEALRDRATHTGTQAMSTVTGLEAALTTLAPNLQTGTSYTLVLADAGKRVSMSNAAANTLTVPLNSTVAFPVNTRVFVSQDGAGATSIAATGGVTINTFEGLNVGGQYKMVSLIKTATDTWLAIGTTV